MAGLTNKLIERYLGPNGLDSGFDRTWNGLRVGDRRELLLGLSLLGISYLKKTKPQKELIYRKTVPKGSAIVVHHRKRGQPTIEVLKPKK